MKGILFRPEMIKAIREGRKTQTRRRITKNNSYIGEGGNWDKLDFYGQTVLSDHQKKIWRSGDYEVGSLCETVIKDKYKAPLPWVDNSVEHWQYLHVPYDWVENGTIYRVYPHYQIGEVVYIKEAWCLGAYAYKHEADIIYKLGALSEQVTVITISWNDWLESHTTYGASSKVEDKWRSPLFMPAWAARYFIQITDVKPQRLQEINFRDTEAEGIWIYEDPWKAKGLSVSQCRMRYARLWDSINPDYPWASNPWVWVYNFIRTKENV